jgi:hypothetical protein
LQNKLKGDRVMYILFGNQIVDSEEIGSTIENNSDFIVEKDLSKSTKREDVVAFQLSIEINILNEYLKDDYDLENIDEEELFEEYMVIADEAAMELEEYLPESIIANARSYKWDKSDNSIKVIITIAHEDMGELKISDISKRLLTQVD